MDYKKEIKKKKIAIKKQEIENYHQKTDEIDKKLDKYKTKKVVTPIDFFKLGYFWRSFIWLIQIWLEVLIAFVMIMYTAESVLPVIGNNIGHALGLSTNSKLIDQVNLMYLPTIFCGVFLVIGEYLILKYIWKFFNYEFGKVRMRSKEKHHLD